MKLHKDGSLPDDNQIFVFGSNLSGRHGKGAAKLAKDKFGAIYGQGVGLMGRSYAIPTKNKLLKSLSLKEIKQFVDQFIIYAKLNQDKEFFITSVGCGLAGYTSSDIAPFFKPLSKNKNCSFPENWKKYLEI